MQTHLVNLIALVVLVSVTATTRADDTMAAMEAISVDVLKKSTTMWNDDQLPSYSEGQPEISVVKVTIPEGQSLPLHEHPFATAGVLLQGHLEVRTPDGDRTELKAGQALIELINQPHAGANIGDGPAVILVVYAGIEGQSVTRLIGSDDSDKDSTDPL
jgi:quercetin dioxygenase-like cupin family protein